METDPRLTTGPRTANLVDILDRVLEKGLVVAGDIKVSLADIELLTIRIRLMICSVDKAEQIGLDFWKYDPHFGASREPLVRENAELKKRLRTLERRVAALVGSPRKPQSEIVK